MTVESVIHAEVDRQTDQTELEALERASAACDRRGARGRRGLAGDARPGARRVAAELGAGVAADRPEDAPRRRPSSSGWRTTTSPSSATATTTSSRRTASCGWRGAGRAGDPARRPAAPTSRAGFAQLPPGVRARALEPFLLNLTKANSRATVHRPAYLDYVGVKRFDDGRRSRGRAALPRPLHALRLPRRARRHPDPAPQARDRPRPRRLPARQPQREGADPDPRVATRATSFSRSGRRAVRDRDGDPAPRRAPAGAAVRAPRRLRALPFLPRLHPARPLQHREPAAHRAHPAGGLRRHEHRRHDARLGVGARAPALHRSTPSPGSCRQVDAAEVEARLVAATRSWTDDLEDALVEEHGEEAGIALLPPLRATPSRPPTARTGWRARRWPTSARIEALDADDDLALQPLPAARGRARRAALEALPRGRPARALRHAADVREHGRRGRRRAPLRDQAARRRRRLDLRLRPHLRAATTSSSPTRVREAFQDAFIRAWRGEAENDGFNRLVLRAGLRGARSPCSRGGEYLRQAGLDVQRPLRRGGARRPPATSRASWCELFGARFDPARADEREAERARSSAIERGDRRASRASTRTASCAASSTSSGDPAHQLLPARRRRTATSRTSRSSSTRRSSPGCRRRARSSRSSSTRRAPRACTCAAARSPAAGSAGRTGATTSAPRSSGLMKAQMVKNAVIVPVGRQGRLRRQAPAAAATARPCPRRSWPATGPSSAACSTSPTTSSAARSSRRRGVVRYDGDDPYLVVAADKGTATLLRHRQRDRRASTASGSATPSPRAARAATTTRRWASPRAARGSRSSATSASSGHDIQSEDFTVVGIGDMSGDVFGNGMLLSRHIRLVAAFDHRARLPRPRPRPGERATRSASACSSSPRSSWADYDAA